MPCTATVRPKEYANLQQLDLALALTITIIERNTPTSNNATTGLSQSSTDATNRCQPSASIRAMSPGRFSASACGTGLSVLDGSPAPAQKCRDPAARSSTARTAGFE